MTDKTPALIAKEVDYIEALSAVLKTWRAMPGTIEYRDREKLLILIREYEQKHNIRHNK